MKTLIYLLLAIAAAAGLYLWTTGSPSGNAATTKDQIIVYKSPTCGCCGNYITYLKKNGFSVKVVETNDIESIKKQYGVPSSAQSCHTSVLGDYYIEGHVPAAAINKLASEKPKLKGITLPGMPSGSPGMGGSQTGDFNIHGIDENGSMSTYTTL